MSQITEFLFAEFADGQPVEFLRVGVFVDRHGKTVEIDEDTLDELVANFAAGAAGQDVPVDVEHRRSQAAGWVRAVRRDGDRLLAEIDWNALGVDLVGERIYRYLSATIDTARNTLRAISLVNFPAVKGLSPVELSEGVYTMGLKEGLIERLAAAIATVLGEGGDPKKETRELMIRDEDGEVVLYSKDGSKVLGRFPYGDGEKYANAEAAREAAEEREAEIQRIKQAEAEEAEDDIQEDIMEEQLREQIRAEIEAEMREVAQTEAELREQVRTEVEAELAEQIRAEMAEEEERKRKLTEFADEVCGGEAGLSTSPDELIELMAGMDDGQVERLQGVLKAKVVDFTERGTARDGEIGSKKALPDRVARALSDGEIELSDLGNPILGLDELDKYDLSKWQDRK